MPSANSQWRSYVSRHQRRTNRTPKSGVINSGAQATARLGGGTNRVASAEIANATENKRHWPRSGGSVL